MRVTVKREAKDRLSIRVWSIWLRDTVGKLSIVFDRYSERSRPTTKHQYRTDKKWERTMSRHNDWDDKEVRQFLTPDIIQEAKDIIIKEVENIEVS